LRDKATQFDPVAGPFIAGLKMTVRVISAQNVPAPAAGRREVIDPYVRVTMYGVPADDGQPGLTTRVVNDNGINPVWDERCQFDVKRPELALLVFEGEPL
jgi:hypothetical protein